MEQGSTLQPPGQNQGLEESAKKCLHCGGEHFYKIGTTTAGNKTYRCKQCNKHFTPGSLKKLPLPNGLACPRCGGEHLKRHSKRTGKPAYLCKECKKFFTPGYLRQISPLPNGIVCPECSSNRVYRAGKTKTGIQRYSCQECKRSFREQYKASPSQYSRAKRGDFIPSGSPLGEYEKDIWDFRNLGITLPPARHQYTLNFTKISQPWLLLAAKQFLKYSLATGSPGHASNRLDALKYFSEFLAKYYPSIEPKNIDRSVIVEYLAYMAGHSRVKGNTKRDRIIQLREFLKLCAVNNWADVPDRNLFFREDIPKYQETLPRYIPQEVVEQLNQNLDLLPEPIMRMVLIIQEVRMRVSELCLLPGNCLSQDTQGSWWIKYRQWKLKNEISKPISTELVAVIQEQQKFIQENLEPEYPYLFCMRKGQAARYGRFVAVAKPPETRVLGEALNTLASQKNICDSSGKLWHFQSHQFRHTVGTTMINNGVPQHIVQRYLGHASPRMTAIYAQIFDATLKQEFAKFHGKVVNVFGEIVESKNQELETTDLQWFKRNIQAQSLPNGSCALPTIAQQCPHANACLTCSHFRTTIEFLSQHKEQLQQTEKILEKAKANGWERQVEMNERVAQNLQNIINTLSEKS